MTMRRSKGRPAHSSLDKGREKLLEAARISLRARIEIDLTRQEIARSAGVTPALVTYYFSNKSDLIIAATQPVLEEAIHALNSVLWSAGSHRDRLKRLVEIFIEFASVNCRVLDAFVQASLQSDNKAGQNLVLSAFGEMQDFFRSGADAGEWRDFDPTFFIFAVWGMCKFVAEPPAFQVRMFSPDLEAEHSRNKQAESIVELLTHGISAKSFETTHPQ